MLITEDLKHTSPLSSRYAQADTRSMYRSDRRGAQACARFPVIKIMVHDAIMARSPGRVRCWRSLWLDHRQRGPGASGDIERTCAAKKGPRPNRAGGRSGWQDGQSSSANSHVRKSYIGGTTPLPNNTAPASSVPSACFSVGTKTCAPGSISLCSAGTSSTIGTSVGMVIFFSPPL